MKKSVYFLTNNYFKLLETMYNNQVFIENKSYCNLTQDELSKLLNVSRNTIGTMIKKMYEQNLLISNKNTKKYVLSDEAKRIIKKMQKI